MESIDIGADALREWLENGRPVTVLDIRSPMQREEWCIPGSIHVDAQAAMRATAASTSGDGLTIAGVKVPQDRPVVTVCAEGKTSLIAVQAMREQGIGALSLKGGMRAWSLMWNLADVPLPGSRATIIQVRRTGKGCLSYIVGSKAEAAVIDASIDPDVYVRIAKDRGLTITHVIDTHVHADHLSRSRLLAERCSVPVMLPEQDRVTYPFRALHDGERIPVGEISIHVMHTPGHTMESTSYMVDGRALLTGDTLFPGAVGRPDLAASAEQARQRAHLLHKTLEKMAKLPPATLILPGHTSEPIAFDGVYCGAPLEEVLRTVEMLKSNEESFVATLLSRIPPNPPYHLEIVRLNELGEFPEGDPTSLEAGANRCAVA